MIKYFSLLSVVVWTVTLIVAIIEKNIPFIMGIISIIICIITTVRDTMDGFYGK